MDLEYSEGDKGRLSAAEVWVSPDYSPKTC